MSIHHDKIKLVDYTYLRYRAVFIFIWECTRLLPNEMYRVRVKYIFDYKVKFLDILEYIAYTNADVEK